MTKAEFVEKINNGSDILFDVGDRHFAIFTWTENGITIGEQYTNNADRHFNNANDLVKGFLIDGIPLEDVVKDIIITDYS